MDWARDLPGWPNEAHSRQVACRPHRWHVQEAGSGQTLLLLHGAGGATQSWRDVFPRLAEHYHVVALDLPGQGFTRMGTRTRSGLWSTRDDIAALCADQGWHPFAIIGHSAGAALALALAPRMDEARVVGINAALDNFPGVAGWLFPVLAKLLSLNPFIPGLVSRAARKGPRVRQLIEGTGSELDERGLELYQRLISDRDHVDGTLAMMAAWSLDQLLRNLPGITVPTLFLTGALDQTVPPVVSLRASEQMPNATVQDLPKLGHLAHEEDPDLVCRIILDWLGGPGSKKATPT